MKAEAEIPTSTAGLVDIASYRSECQPLRHLSGLPIGLLDTIDVALMVDGGALPAHSFVLMAMSPVFCEAFSTQVNMLNPQKVLKISLAGSTGTREELALALEHMYFHCMPRPGKTGLNFRTAIVSQVQRSSTLWRCIHTLGRCCQ